MTILFLVGLTGAGKSTVLPSLLSGGARRPLPDRRELTDRIILPAALELEGLPARPVTDRLERFRLTSRYRQEHPDGIVHALCRHLSDEPPGGEVVFDGLRGDAEVRAAAERFPGARFLMLEASPETRVRRLAARADEFDRQAGANRVMPGHAVSGDGYACVAPEEEEHRDALRRAERIVAEEQRHYDQAAAKQFLAGLAPVRRLVLVTDSLPPDEVIARVRAWL